MSIKIEVLFSNFINVSSSEALASRDHFLFLFVHFFCLRTFINFEPVSSLAHHSH